MTNGRHSVSSLFTKPSGLSDRIALETDKIARFSMAKDGSGNIGVRLVQVALLCFEQGSAMATAVAAAEVAAANVTASVAHFVSMKVIEGSGPALRKWAVIAVMRIKTIIHVTEEAM